MTVEEKISHIREAAMEEARARGNEIIDQHQKALEGVFKTHKQEAVMQADTRIKTETASARQQLNTVTSKGQLKLRRQLSRVQNELKNKLFEEVREMAEEYMKTEAYKELLVSYIAKAARFADGNPLTIYINSSDEDKKRIPRKTNWNDSNSQRRRFSWRNPFDYSGKKYLDSIIHFQVLWRKNTKNLPLKGV